MASSSETITIHSLHDDEDDDDRQNNHGLSRLSVLSRSNCSTYDDDDDDMGMHLSRLSMEESKTGFESSDGDADGELSDDKEKEEIAGDLTDSDKEMEFSGSWGYFNLATPVWRTRRNNQPSQPIDIRKRGSEAETKSCSRRKLRGRVGEKWLEKAWEVKKSRAFLIMDENDCNNSCESEGVVRRGSLCMDIDEVKACRDLGFELKNHVCRISGATIDTSSDGNSPIASLRISSPGDDPRDVKARLKVWAQAVALASTAHLNHC